MGIAELAWYDLPELRAATDAWWRGIAAHLRRLGVGDVPAALVHDGHPAARWRHRDLLLGQACGYEVLHDYADALVAIATPQYRVPGCDGPRYRSRALVRRDAPWRTLADLRGARVAVNEPGSHSGANALRALVAPLARDGGFFRDVVLTGSHANSLATVANGGADLACVDVVVLALLADARPAALASLRALVDSATAPAPPYVTSSHTPPALRAVLQQALAAAARDPELAAVRATLRLDGFAFLPATAYDELHAFEAGALAAGYHELPAPAASPLSSAPRVRRS